MSGRVFRPDCGTLGRNGHPNVARIPGGLRLSSPESFAVAFSRDGAAAVVAVSGDVDMASSPALGDALTGIIVEQGSLSVRVDLARVTFLDSSGLTVLVMAHKELQRRDGTMVVANPPARIVKLLEITGLTSVLDITLLDESVPRRPGWHATVGVEPTPR